MCVCVSLYIIIFHYIYIYLYRQNVYVSSPIDQAEAEQVSIPAQSDTTVPQWE